MNDNMVRIFSQSWANIILYTSDSGPRKIFHVDFTIIQWTWYGGTFNLLYYTISQNINSLRVLYRIIYLTFFLSLLSSVPFFFCCFNISNIISTIIYIVYIIIINIVYIIIACISVKISHNNYIIMTYFIIIYIIISCDIIFIIIVIIINNITDIIIDLFLLTPI